MDGLEEMYTIYKGMSLLGYDYSQEPTILGTNDLYFNTLTDGIISIGNGDIVGGNLISTNSLYVNGVNILSGGSGGPQGPQGRPWNQCSIYNTIDCCLGNRYNSLCE